MKAISFQSTGVSVFSQKITVMRQVKYSELMMERREMGEEHVIQKYQTFSTVMAMLVNGVLIV